MSKNEKTQAPADVVADTGRTPADAPLLSILIPTFQRAYMLKNVLHRFVAAVEWAGLSPSAVEIVISDNQSTDGTAAVAADFTGRYPYIRYYRQPVHYNTGEENIFTAMPECRGTYVWTFSDDDIPEVWGLRTVIDMLESRPCDLILANPALINAEGKMLAEKMIDCSFDAIEMAPQDLIATFGMINLSCCFSAVIYRRDRFLTVDWRQYIAASPIYSHVVMYCEAFNGGRALFLNTPVLQYRIGGTEEGAWKTRSRILKLPMRFPWSVGLIRLVRFAKSRGAVPVDFLHRVTERDLEGPFLLNELVLWELTNQFMIWIESGVDYEAVTEEHINEYLDEFSLAELFHVEALYRLERVRQVWTAVSAEPGSAADGEQSIHAFIDGLPDAARDATVALVRQWALKTVNEVRAIIDPRRAVRPQGRYGKYNLFRFAAKFVAIDDAVDDIDITRVDFQEEPPTILVRPSMAELRRDIDRHDPGAVRGHNGGVVYGSYTIHARKDHFLAIHTAHPRPLPAGSNVWRHYPAMLAHKSQETLRALIDAVQARAAQRQIRFTAENTAQRTDNAEGMRFYFDEEWYLQTHGAARQAVQERRYPDGFAHFRAEGLALRLDPSPFFHERSAAALYPNVAEAIDAGLFASWFDFYYHLGRHLGFSPSAYFDEGLYRSLYPDVSAAVDSGHLVCAFDHYIPYGVFERRLPTLFFEENWYSANRPADGTDGDAIPSLYLHYLKVGEPHRVDPCSWFNGQRYLECNPHVGVEIERGGYRSGFHHWATVGGEQALRLL